MALHHKRAGGTKWLCNADAGPLACNEWALRRRALPFLERRLVEIWAHESPGGKTMPRLTFGPGMVWQGQRVSFCHGHSHIELAAGQRNVRTLIHEITHALGHPWHNNGFIRRYLGLLARYGRYDADLIAEVAASRGLTAPQKPRRP